MQALAFLFLILAVAAMADFGHEGAWERSRAQGDAMAMQMLAYHGAAVRRCQASPCGNGAVAGLSGVPGSRWPYGVDFVSASNGSGTVVTAYAPRQAATDPRHLFGPVNAALRERTHGAVNAGPWDAATQRIGLGVVANNSWNPSHPASGLPVAVRIAVPQGFGGLALADQQPVIATRIN